MGVVVSLHRPSLPQLHYKRSQWPARMASGRLLEGKQAIHESAAAAIATNVSGEFLSAAHHQHYLYRCQIQRHPSYYSSDSATEPHSGA